MAQQQINRAVISYYFHYSDGTLFPLIVGVMEEWQVHHIDELDLTGQIIEENGTSRIVAAGPDETGLIMFEDDGEAYLRCRFFQGQQTDEERMKVYELDRAAREKANMTIPARR